jgi:hypothetical protein
MRSIAGQPQVVVGRYADVQWPLHRRLGSQVWLEPGASIPPQSAIL